MQAKDLVYLWFAAYGATLVAFVARMAWVLFGSASEPPEEPLELSRWKRKRRWLLASEFFALPLFATTAVLATARGLIDSILAIFYALVCALLGFAFFLRATRRLVSDKLGLEQDEGDKK